ncbi:MAG: CvpA family protein [Alphaproteobacteria bacterium]|nr:CvpA family protein [Alphaproteobacteria bacterium]
MNPLDIGVLAVVVISALLAFSRGIVRELLSVAGWVAAAFATLYIFPYVQPLARKYISITLAADLGAALIIFLATLTVISIGSGWLARQIHDTDFKPLDRSLGFVFGALRGLVLLCLAYLLFNWAYKPDEQPVWVKEARSRPVLAYGARVLVSVVPEDFLKGSDVGIKELGKRTGDQTKGEDAIKKLLPKLPKLPDIPKTPGATGATTGS